MQLDFVFSGSDTNNKIQSIVDTNEAAMDELGTMMATVAPSPTVVSHMLEDLEMYSNTSSSSVLNDDLPDLPPLDMDQDQRSAEAASPYHAIGSTAPLANYVDMSLEPVRLADGRLVYAKFFGYVGDAETSAVKKISKNVLRVRPLPYPESALLMFLQRMVWKSSKNLLGVMRQKVHVVLPNSSVCTRTLEPLLDSTPTGSTSCLIYRPNWEEPADHPVNNTFIRAVIMDVQSEVHTFDGIAQQKLIVCFP
jgi:hypothetical protein